jgi:hypothetical protein
VFYYKLAPNKDLSITEREYLFWYLLEYGEPPMLNASLPGRYDDYR